MDRRGFITGAAVGAGVLGATALPAWLSGCGAAPLRAELGARETTELLRRLDRGLEVASREPMGDLGTTAPWRIRPDLTENVLRLGVSALVVADVARSIPENTPVPGELRESLVGALPILDQCTATYHQLLRRTPPAVRRSVDHHFRADPDAAMNVASYLDAHASRIGISPESRLRMRSNASHVTTRIRRQSANALVDDCLVKVEASVARSGGSVAGLRSSTTAALIDAIWQTVDGAGSGGTVSGGGTGAIPPPPAAYGGGTVSSGSVLVEPSPPSVSEGAAPEESSPGDSELMVGGILIGSGLAVFGIGTLIGWAAGSAAWGAIISATPGGALVITGIILLIVGAVQNGSAS